MGHRRASLHEVAPELLHRSVYLQRYGDLSNSFIPKMTATTCPARDLLVLNSPSYFTTTIDRSGAASSTWFLHDVAGRFISSGTVLYWCLGRDQKLNYGSLLVIYRELERVARLVARGHV